MSLRSAVGFARFCSVSEFGGLGVFQKLYGQRATEGQLRVVAVYKLCFCIAVNRQ
jgi:hypothetical protein